jgi:hypothetical protein
MPDVIVGIDFRAGDEPMRARIDVSLTAVEPMALWSRDAQADRRSVATSDAGFAETETVTETIAEAVSWSRLLDWYLEGWAEANVAKIFAATAHGYRFDDPLVGTFSRWSFPVYFEHLRGRFARAGAIATRDFTFSVSGPTDGPRRRGRLKFFREAPQLGLSGITFITIGERGIIAENVSYDLNLASDVLRNLAGGPGEPSRF